MGYGLIPSIEAAQLSGIPISHRSDLGGWVPDIGKDGVTSIDGVFLCGDGAGIRGAAAAELHGTLAGLSAAEYLGAQTEKERTTLRPRFNRAARFGLAMTALNIPRPGLAMLTTPDTIVCRCESLTQTRISQEVEVGATSSNAVKSSLRAGMGPCGGQYCQTAIARLIAMRQNRPEAEIPPPTPRPPLRPISVSALSGDFDYNDLPIPKPAPL
jgi:bacterioferritin-associated ferredoxin